MTHTKKPKITVKQLASRLYSRAKLILPKNRALRTGLLLIIAVVLVSVGSMYAVAQWYIIRHADKPLQLGVSFIPRYAEGYGLDAKQTMQAMIDELGVKRFRLVSYWEDIEKTPGNYDFSQLDWQFKKAEDAGAQISLAIGLRQPRWPECHAPEWAKVHSDPEHIWLPKLKEVIRRTIERYKDSPALESYQLENEYFLKVFGICSNFNRDRLVDEYNYVKSLDPNTTLLVSRSNNAIGLPIGKPTPDLFGVSVYKRVWDKTLTKRYFEYPFPAWFYGFLAGAGEILTGKDMIIHELQAEPWAPYGPMTIVPTEELNKSLDATRLKGRFDYGRGTGIRTIDLWGAEYWYYQKIIRHNSSLWDVAKQEFSRSN